MLDGHPGCQLLCFPDGQIFAFLELIKRLKFIKPKDEFFNIQNLEGVPGLIGMRMQGPNFKSPTNMSIASRKSQKTDIYDIYDDESKKKLETILEEHQKLHAYIKQTQDEKEKMDQLHLEKQK